MYEFLLNAFRVTLIAFVAGGTAVTVLQIVGIVTANPAMINYFGGDFADTVCVVAGLAGVFSFLQLYTPQGRAAAAALGAAGDEEVAQAAPER
ncbi:hypothetical protein SMC26_14115 [Actinomadura fulvescens]|uniref:Uncharacterized protein n=1 Tax=Actinomadura fulvescens TaxID=46160 RepID=A0ABN3Q347_9ACTN